jgi:hypothetical protein
MRTLTVSKVQKLMSSGKSQSPPGPPLRNARRLGPYAHDGSRGLEVEDPAPIGAYPRRRPFRRPASREEQVPLRGRIEMNESLSCRVALCKKV